MKNNADALIFHTTICVEAPQIVLMHRAKTATLLFARASSAALRNGEKMAVVGMNGSGKTTMIKLLCRLYDVTEGEILLNGVNIKKYDQREYRQLFSVVFQDFHILPYTLGENVAASGEPDPERVMECLEKAGLGERVRNLPEGLQTRYETIRRKWSRVFGRRTAENSHCQSHLQRVAFCTVR